MSKNVVINGVAYNDVTYVSIPLASPGTGNAKFMDTDIASNAAAAGDIRNGKKGFVNGSEVTGTVPVKTASDVTVNGKNITTPAGIYDSAVTKSVADASVIVTANCSSDYVDNTETDYPVSVRGALFTSGGYVSGDVLGDSTTKYIQVEEKSVTPTTSAQEINPSSGKLIKKINVAAVSVGGNAAASDVLAGKTFLSAGSLAVKTGTATVPVVSQDSTTKVLSIS